MLFLDEMVAKDLGRVVEGVVVGRGVSILNSLAQHQSFGWLILVCFCVLGDWDTACVPTRCGCTCYGCFGAGGREGFTTTTTTTSKFYLLIQTSYAFVEIRHCKIFQELDDRNPQSPPMHLRSSVFPNLPLTYDHSYRTSTSIRSMFCVPSSAVSL